jgi:SHS2 domain-containing protein
MKKFEFLPHTADVKIRVYGKNLKEIVNNSLLALKSFWKPKLTKTKIEKEIKIESNNEVNLLIDFLSEILAETYIEKAIFIKFLPQINPDFHADKRGLYSLSGKIIGYEFTSLSKDIKAITYHQANLQKINHQYIFEFIIDI